MSERKSDKTTPVKEAREAAENDQVKDQAGDQVNREPDYKKEAEDARKEAQENYNKWLYLRADLENFKKRHYREMADLIKYGHEHFARELLEVVDALESALSHARKKDQDMSALGEGIALTRKQFLKILKQFGITPIESIGKKFDPAYHKAIAEQADDGREAGAVLQEHKKGYMLYDRLLRAAHVIVAKKKEKENGKE